MPTSKINLIQNLLQLEQEVENYVKNQGPFFEIEKDQMLQSIRKLYTNVQAAKIEQETVKSNSGNQEAQIVNNDLKEEIHDLKEQLERYRQQEIDRQQKLQRDPNWQESPEARYNELESKLNSGIVEQFVKVKDPVSPSAEPEAIEPSKQVPHASSEDVQAEAPEQIKVEPDPETIVPEQKPSPKKAVSSSPRHARFSLRQLIESQTDGSLLSNLKQKPVDDLKKSIGLNEKFLYIRELFDNDHQEFAAVIDQLNGMASVEEAERFIEKDVLLPRDWDLENEHVFNFMTVIYRRFIK